VCLQGGRVLDRSQQLPNPCPGWVSEEAWDNLSSLEQLPAFKDLGSSIESASQDWELWFRQAQPEAAELPRDWEAKCNELQRLLLVRSLRPDRVIFAATTYVANSLGRQYVEPPVLDLGQALADSSPHTPLIFVLSPGVDPTDQLRKLAAERGMADKLHTVALGQGQVRGCFATCSPGRKWKCICGGSMHAPSARMLSAGLLQCTACKGVCVTWRGSRT
jgi:dynein heavy chain